LTELRKAEQEGWPFFVLMLQKRKAKIMDILYIMEVRIIKKFRIHGGYYDQKSNCEY
jgi:hypothetical protein